MIRLRECASLAYGGKCQETRSRSLIRMFRKERMPDQASLLESQRLGTSGGGQRDDPAVLQTASVTDLRSREDLSEENSLFTELVHNTIVLGRILTTRK